MHYPYMRGALTNAMRCAYSTRMVSPEHIKRIRLALGENQTKFAKRFGVDQSTIHRWETYGVPDRGAAPIAVDRILKEIKQLERGAA